MTSAAGMDIRSLDDDSLEGRLTEFFRKQTGATTALSSETSLDDVGLAGDDVGDFLDDFASQFDVDMSSYLWYFHTSPESWGPGSLFLSPRNSVEHIPITIRVLSDSAREGKWVVAYPQHPAPTDSYVKVDWAFAVVLAASFCAAFVWYFFFR